MESPPPPPPPHFMIITFPAQGHLNPALHLAKRLASSTAARVTFSTAVSAQRRMFPSLSSDSQVVHDGIIYIPFSDGSSSSSSSLHNPNNGDLRSSISQIKQFGSNHLNAILRDLADSGHPVTCVIYTIMLQWAGDVAFDLGIPSALFWIQAATVLSIYYHFFHGYQQLIAAHAKDPFFPISFPSLPVFQIRELPTFLTITTPDEPFFDILDAFRQVFETLSPRGQSGQKPKVLVNSFDELEPDALASMSEHMELVTVGPAMPVETETFTADTSSFILPTMSTASATPGGCSGHKKRRNRSRLRMHAPASIQVGPPPSTFAEWNVAIPLLSPLDIVSLPSIGDLRPPDVSSEEGESPVADGCVDRKWRHPAEPFFYEPPPANSPAFALSRCS